MWASRVRGPHFLWEVLSGMEELANFVENFTKIKN